jgi:hypothetical protein
VAHFEFHRGPYCPAAVLRQASVAERPVALPPVIKGSAIMTIDKYDVSKAALQGQSGRDTAEMLALLLPDASKAQRDKLAREQGKLYAKQYLPSVRAFNGVRELFR